MLLKLHDRSDSVSELQKILSLLGYDLVIDGIFDAKTERSVKSFQKKNNLSDNGVVRDDTWQALKISLKRGSKEVKGKHEELDYGDIQVIKRDISHNQFIKQINKKKQIFLHLTESGPNADSILNSWGESAAPATAYIIDRRDGSIYEIFNPSYWSFHLGVKSTRGRLDKQSIGISLCNWGALYENNEAFWSYTRKEVPQSDVDEMHWVNWKGHKFFESITDEQIESLEKLLRFLVDKYEIKVQSEFDETFFDFNQEVIDKNLPGIWSHGSVRQDKIDLFPTEKITEMLNRIAKND